MGPTRAALLAAAGQCLVAAGARRTTMLDIALAAGVAKGTVYNHFRTRDDLYRALAESELDRILALAADTAREHGAAAGLRAAALTLREHPVIRRLRAHEPEVLTALLLAAGTPAAAAAWARARAGVADLAAPGAADLALRWLVSWTLLPGDGDGDGACGGVELLAAAAGAVG